MSEQQVTMGKYVGAYVALLALTALTFGLSYLALGVWEWPAALGIASAKGVLVALFFMHLVEMSPAHRLSGVVAVALLAILILFAMADVWTRSYVVGPEVPRAQSPKRLEALPGQALDDSGGSGS